MHRRPFVGLESQIFNLMWSIILSIHFVSGIYPLFLQIAYMRPLELQAMSLQQQSYLTQTAVKSFGTEFSISYYDLKLESWYRQRHSLTH